MAYYVSVEKLREALSPYEEIEQMPTMLEGILAVQEDINPGFTQADIDNALAVAQADYDKRIRDMFFRPDSGQGSNPEPPANIDVTDEEEQKSLYELYESEED